MKTIYKSELKELADKEFESMEACEAEEAKVNNAIAKKQEAAAKRKADAAIVDEAIKAELEAKKAYVEKKKELDKQYLEEKQALDKKYLEGREALTAELDKATDAVSKALEDFCKEHPEGYHNTIKFDDGSTRTFSYKTSGNADKVAFSDIIDAMFTPFWRW